MWHDIISVVITIRDKRFPVITVRRVLRLRMEERPPIWRAATNILNKQSRTADSVWSSSLGVGWGAITVKTYHSTKSSRRSTCERGNKPSISIKCGILLLLLLLLQRYNLCKVLDCSTTFFQLSLFCATFFQLPMFMLFISSKPSSSQRGLGLQVGLLGMGFHPLIFCTI